MTTPPLLMLIEGRKPRLRKAPLARPKEIALHMDVARLLRDHARPDWQWTHIGHGEQRSPRVAAKLKRMGLRPGWPDFLLICPRGRAHLLELKRIGEELSDPQEDFKAWSAARGVPHVVAYETREVLIAFAEWRCLDDEVAGLLRNETKSLEKYR
jgi:hypothetical protein